MPKILTITPPEGPLKGHFRLPASKSESNRALIIQALSQGKVSVSNLSESEDTQTMLRLLNSNAAELNVGHAGTVMRFLTAYLAFQSGEWVAKGSGRMHQRPIGLLVEALNQLGAEISYLEVEGYPPLKIKGVPVPKGNHRISIPGNISSQFISALLMVAPHLPRGIELELIEPVFSVPYIQMTLDMLADCGIFHHWVGNVITIAHQSFKQQNLSIEGDWSSASYGYSLAGMIGNSSLTLSGLKEKSLQGDRVIAEFMNGWGVESNFLAGGVEVENGHPISHADKEPLIYNMLGCPDLTQTLAVYFSAKGIPAIFTGVDSLRIKETDRILALQVELAKFGVKLEEKGAALHLSGEFRANPDALIQTYDDHRMALAFAPLALVNGGIRIEDPGVIVKSFPGYWDALAKLGFELEWEG